ncbi:hypothetical protein DBV14_15735 [Variovorax sp. KBW07]|uniref:hypothetical protein n=1 Tax=Variovorax sp. KBW07 TaxID=2153358 RepID=UPI000F581F4E|nr:hypothetical protein [Variovorax sp. KBW07]RQO52816.1 hypothetical protein DBV14_15735 [Variovorax sp. KBW07]
MSTTTATATELPEALKPWHPWLEWFGLEIAAELGALIQRMQPLLGRFQGQTRGGQPEPDGLDDLRRRGRYERLLSTEWLLADELPDEFLRRAASSEHLFLAPRPRSREAEKGIVAIFDAGPLQLGASRLGQLALWILLARRAALSGGALRWGVLQLPGQLHDAHDARQLKALMKSRNFVVGDAGQGEAWREALAELPHPPGESWLIGAAPVEPPMAERWTSHRIRLCRAVQGDVLEVSLSGRDALRHAQLPLPSVKAAVPLLKGEFAQAAPATVHQRHRGRISLQRPPLISSQGTHVAVQLLDEPGVVVFPVASLAQRKAGKPRYQRWGDRLEPLTAMFAGKRLGALLGFERSMYFWQVQGLGNFVAPEPEVFRAPPGLGVWLPSVWLHSAQKQCVCVIDRDGRLVAWEALRNSTPSLEPGPPKLVDQRVVGMLQWADGGLVYATIRSKQLVLCYLGVEVSPSTVLTVCAGADDTVVLFGGGTQWRRGIGSCAVRTYSTTSGNETWRVYEPTPLATTAGMRHVEASRAWTSFELNIHRGVALVHDTKKARFVMLSLSPERTALVLHAKDASPEVIYVAPERIEKISVCPNTGLAVMLTVHKKVIFYVVPERSLRAVLHGEGASDANA